MKLSRFLPFRIFNTLLKVAVVLALITTVAAAVHFYPAIYEQDLKTYIFNHKYRDSVMIATELGRLDFVSIILAVLGAMIALLSFIGFGYIRFRADEIARDTAKDVAEEVAKQVAEKVAKDTMASLNSSRRRGEDTPPQAVPVSPEDFSTGDTEPEDEENHTSQEGTR